MASITRQANGRRLIQFVGADGERKTLRLGAVTQRTAEAVKVRVEHLVAASINGHAVDDATAQWLTTLEEPFLAKLASVGLVPRRAAAGPLKEFLDAYIAARADTKSATRVVYGHTQRCLTEFFGAHRQLRDITPGDADEWRLWLINDQKLAENTVRRRCGVAKQFFRAAVRKKLIAENAFADLAAAVRGNPKKMYFISRNEAQAVLDACPDTQWRLIFALSRFGGLRCPSEHLGLRWTDVNWEQNRLTVHSPKTEQYEGGALRQVPIFPELLPHLRQAFEEAEEGAKFLVTRYREPHQNLRTTFLKIIRRAGLNPWPKLFQNLRSTRETELAETYPLHVVCSWIGNSEPVAAKHYLQVTDEHFAQAAAPEQALQNALQHSAARGRTASQDENGKSDNSATCQEIRDGAIGCDNAETAGMGQTGLEPVLEGF